MLKKLVSALVLVCMVCCLLAACGSKNITAEEAWKVVQKDLGEFADKAETPHIHNGTYDNQECFNIFVTVAGESLVYVVSATGEILHKGVGSHNH